MSEAIVERGFPKMGEIVTKTCTALDDNSLEMLVRISYNNPINPIKYKWHKGSPSQIEERERLQDICKCVLAIIIK